MAEHHHNTEALILAAAEREFLDKGFAGARTTAIAKAAGVTHAMLHYYFHTKEQLFEKIVDNKFGMLGEIMAGSILNDKLPLLERVRNVIEHHIDFMAANPGLPRFIVNELFSNPERLKSIPQYLPPNMGQLFRQLQTEINEAADRGECRRVDARMLIIDIVSLNIFPFLGAPMAIHILGSFIADKETFVEARKKENVETIMRKLRP